VLKGVIEAEHQPDQCQEVRAKVSLEGSEGLQDMIKIDGKCRVCWRYGVN
jgi:hypothetical protein